MKENYDAWSTREVRFPNSVKGCVKTIKSCMPKVQPLRGIPFERNRGAWLAEVEKNGKILYLMIHTDTGECDIMKKDRNKVKRYFKDNYRRRGASLDLAAQSLNEWANSINKNLEDRGEFLEQPEGETVDLSLRRYLGANPMPVKLTEKEQALNLAKNYKRFLHENRDREGHDWEDYVASKDLDWEEHKEFGPREDRDHYAPGDKVRVRQRDKYDEFEYVYGTIFRKLPNGKYEIELDDEYIKPTSMSGGETMTAYGHELSKDLDEAHDDRFDHPPGFDKKFPESKGPARDMLGNPSSLWMQGYDAGYEQRPEEFPDDEEYADGYSEGYGDGLENQDEFSDPANHGIMRNPGFQYRDDPKGPSSWTSSVGEASDEMISDPNLRAKANRTQPWGSEDEYDRDKDYRDLTGFDTGKQDDEYDFNLDDEAAIDRSFEDWLAQQEETRPGPVPPMDHDDLRYDQELEADQEGFEDWNEYQGGLREAGVDWDAVAQEIGSGQFEDEYDRYEAIAQGLVESGCPENLAVDLADKYSKGLNEEEIHGAEEAFESDELVGEETLNELSRSTAGQYYQSAQKRLRDPKISQKELQKRIKGIDRSKARMSGYSWSGGRTQTSAPKKKVANEGMWGASAVHGTRKDVEDRLAKELEDNRARERKRKERQQANKKVTEDHLDNTKYAEMEPAVYDAFNENAYGEGHIYHMIPAGVDNGNYEFIVWGSEDGEDGPDIVVGVSVWKEGSEWIATGMKFKNQHEARTRVQKLLGNKSDQVNESFATARWGFDPDKEKIVLIKNQRYATPFLSKTRAEKIKDVCQRKTKKFEFSVFAGRDKRNNIVHYVGALDSEGPGRFYVSLENVV